MWKLAAWSRRKWETQHLLWSTNTHHFQPPTINYQPILCTKGTLWNSDGLNGLSLMQQHRCVIVMISLTELLLAEGDTYHPATGQVEWDSPRQRPCQASQRRSGHVGAPIRPSPCPRLYMYGCSVQTMHWYTGFASSADIKVLSNCCTFLTVFVSQIAHEVQGSNNEGCC